VRYDVGRVGRATKSSFRTKTDELCGEFDEFWTDLRAVRTNAHEPLAIVVRVYVAGRDVASSAAPDAGTRSEKDDGEQRGASIAGGLVLRVQQAVELIT
jgi:hypothetical protein